MPREKKLLKISLLTLLLVFASFALYLSLPPSCVNRKLPLPHTDASLVEKLQTILLENFQSDAQYLSGLFATREIVFLGELQNVSQNVNLVGRIIPSLYTQNVRILAMEYVLYADQKELDQVLTAPHFDDGKIKEFLFNRQAFWGYQEYADIFRACWEFNQSLAPDQSPMRIIGLANQEDWTFVNDTPNIDNPNILPKANGQVLPDDFMADVLIKEVLEPGQKALVYTSYSHSFTRVHDVDYAASMEKIGYPQARRTAEIIAQLAGDKCATVLFHGPWPRKNTPDTLTYAVNGTFDILMTRLPPDRQYTGFSVTDPLFSSLQFSKSVYAKYASTLGDLCDGYILQGPISQYRACTPIPNFITEENYAQVRHYLPDLKITSLNVQDLNQIISNMSKKLNEIFSYFN